MYENDLKTKTHLSSIISLYYLTINPLIVTCTQFGLWYLFIHTIYWGLEQLRYKWCVSHGLSGYLYSLLVSQSLVCTALTETTKALSNTQISNITMFTTFIGLKCVGLFQKDNNNSTDSTNNRDKTTQTTQNIKHTNDN